MGYSGASGKLIHEENLKSKSRVRLSLKRIGHQINIVPKAYKIKSVLSIHAHKVKFFALEK
jgi:hypothetical protein